MAGKLPSFQFYTGDWLKDPNLRRCCRSVKGLLIDLLCLMHENIVRGKLCEADGVTPWSDDDICAAISGDPREILIDLREAEAKGVLSRDDHGSLYSRRMVRDEHNRQQKVNAGKTSAAVKRQRTANGPSTETPTKRQRKGGSSSSSSASTKPYVRSLPLDVRTISEPDYDRLEILVEELSEPLPDGDLDPKDPSDRKLIIAVAALRMIDVLTVEDWTAAVRAVKRKSDNRLAYLHGTMRKIVEQRGNGQSFDDLLGMITVEDPR